MTHKILKRKSEKSEGLSKVKTVTIGMTTKNNEDSFGIKNAQ